MPKYFFEDMVKAKRAREHPKDVKKSLPAERAAAKEHKEEKEEQVVKTARKEAKNRPRFMLWSIAIISAVFCLFALSFLFGKAQVTVNPKTQDLVLNENLSASKESSGSAMPFDLVAVPGVENKTIQATGEKNVSIKATGTVVLYNNFSSAVQRLDIDTRLEGSNGKMYKTQTQTTIPGISKDGKPGSVEVRIYGAEAGEAYNSDPLDFKVFGFKGTPKYAKFYGRSKGAISGGFVGKAPDITDADRASAILELKNTLRTKLLQKATGQIPSGFILFKEAIFLNTDDSGVSSSYNKDNSLTLTQKGTLYGILFDEKKLTKKIAEDNIDKYDGSDVYIPNIRDLAFSLGGKDNVSFSVLTSISFNLSGPAKIVWKLDTEKFTADLRGKSKKDFNAILSQYVNVDSAVLKLTFPWMQSIPDKAKDIKIRVNYPK